MKLRVIPEPNKPDNISQNSQWLSGLGAGSWFWISYVKEKDVYRICRYSPVGELECDRLFNEGLIYGCGKPFRLIIDKKEDKFGTEKADYI